MKKTMVLFAICLLFACSKPERQPDQVDVLISGVYDITDSMSCRLYANPILGQYGFQNNKDQSARFRLQPISDKKLNPVYDLKIENNTVSDRNNVNEEINYRKNRVLTFYNAIRLAIRSFDSLNSTDTSLPYSECYYTIADELELLANSKASKKVLIVYSDLFENSAVFSCYSTRDLDLLTNNPEKVEAILLKEHLLPSNLSGIRIYVVYSPPNRNDDILFNKIAKVYTHLMTSRGAIITFQATNKYFQQ